MRIGPICAAATLLVVTASMGADKTFDRGVVWITCSCISKTKERLMWTHSVDVPRNGSAIDLNQVCATTRDNYRDAHNLCEQTFRAYAYSFVPAR